MNTNKAVYGIMAFAPLALILMAIVAIVLALIPEENRLAHDPPPMFWVAMGIFGLAGIMSLASLILFIVHISNNRNVEDSARIGWIVGMIFAHGIASIIYFFVHIVNEPKIDPRNTGFGKSEWD